MITTGAADALCPFTDMRPGAEY